MKKLINVFKFSIPGNNKIIKVIYLIVKPFLSEFRWYRKKRGGVWYKVKEVEVSGFGTVDKYWVKEIPRTFYGQVVEIEKYDEVGGGKF